MEALSPGVVDIDDEDVRTIGRKGTGRGRVEVLARERRRTWTPEQKRAIVAESLGSELRPTEVARKYAISSGLLYSWRRLLDAITRTDNGIRLEQVDASSSDARPASNKTPRQTFARA
jgi:transposase-like protein